MTDPGLMQAFHFDEADLAANRAGAVSERQRVTLQAAGPSLAKILRFSLPYVLAGLAIALIRVLRSRGSQGVALNVVLALAGVVLVGLMLLFALRRSEKAISTQAHRSATGGARVVRTLTGADGAEHAVVEVGGVKVTVTGEQARILTARPAWTVHYLGTGGFSVRRVLSVEPA